MRNCFFLYATIVSWYSKKQHRVLTSTTEAKYITLRCALYKSISIRQFLNKLKVEALIRACLLHGNNETSIIFTKNAETQARIKYIDMQHHYICELVADREVEIKWICSTSMLVDRFTKALSADSFKRHRDLLGLIS